MHEQPNNKPMQWVVLAISGGILIISAIANLIDNSFDAKPAYYLFTTISGFIFGASVIRKLQK